MKRIPIFLFLCTLSCSFTANSATVDWSSVDESNITLFYPGQSSWEWLLTQHSAAKSVRKGTNCLECHEGEEAEMGSLLVKKGPLEPNPIRNKPGIIKANLQLAYDNENLYLRLSWPDTQFHSGTKQQDKTAIKVAVMLDDGNVKESKVAGCWGACHADSTNMPHAEGGTKTRQLYLSKSREKITRTGGKDLLVDTEQLNELKASGHYLEYWQAQEQNGTTRTASGYILEKRHAIEPGFVNAKIQKVKNTWHAEFSRPLKSNDGTSKPLNPNQHYTLGFAIHDDYTKGRFHYVSFARSFSLNNQETLLTATKLSR